MGKIQSPYQVFSWHPYFSFIVLILTVMKCNLCKYLLNIKNYDGWDLIWLRGKCLLKGRNENGLCTDLATKAILPWGGAVERGTESITEAPLKSCTDITASAREVPQNV
jgi:hypothetical protein